MPNYLFKKKVFFGGDLAVFDRVIADYIENQCSFNVIGHGFTKEIYFNGKKYIYHGSKEIGFEPGAHLCKYVKRDIDSYIDNNPNPPYFFRTSLQAVNLESVNNNLFLPISCIDIKSCYWIIAYKLGYITDHSFRAGYNKASYKNMRNASIGSLISFNITKKYIDGKEVSCEINTTTLLKYEPYYWKIINIAFSDLLCGLYKILDKDCYMYLTDCVYFDSKRTKEVEDYLVSKGYEYRVFKCLFTDVDSEFVYWDELHTLDSKKISHVRRTFEDII